MVLCLPVFPFFPCFFYMFFVQFGDNTHTKIHCHHKPGWISFKREDFCHESLLATASHRLLYTDRKYCFGCLCDHITQRRNRICVTLLSFDVSCSSLSDFELYLFSFILWARLQGRHLDYPAHCFLFCISYCQRVVSSSARLLKNHLFLFMACNNNKLVVTVSSERHVPSHNNELEHCRETLRVAVLLLFVEIHVTINHIKKEQVVYTL